MIVFTSINLNYLPKARILSYTLKKLHPDWKFHLLLSEKKNSVSWVERELSEFDLVYYIEDLSIPSIQEWISNHSVVELCTAVKGPYLKKLVSEGSGKILYIDPDIAIINSLSELDTLLDDYSILLTPHFVNPPSAPRFIEDNEIAGAMRHGIFNLGFLGINGKKDEGLKFSNWWSNRLENYCFADYSRGLFTDQKWCDFVPAYFENYKIISDPGYNVASWNLDEREITCGENGELLVNKKYLLRFYHFTGYDSGAGESVIEANFSNNLRVKELWDWYARLHKKYYLNDENYRWSFL